MLNDSKIAVAKENIKNVWSELVEMLRNFKESASNLTDPRILGEQLQIMFRDESMQNCCHLTSVLDKTVEHFLTFFNF